MSDILSRILETKRHEIVAAQRLISSGEILKEALSANSDPNAKVRGFAQALIGSVSNHKPGIIAEIKNRVPVRGCFVSTLCHMTLPKVMPRMARPAYRF